MTAIQYAIFTTLAYRPFLDPIPIDRIWMFFALPLIVAIALVYKSIRINSLHRLAHETFRLTAQILLFMVASAVGLWLIASLF